MGRIAIVFFNAQVAGELREIDGGGFEFQYKPDYFADGAPLSYRLPLQQEPFKSDVLFPFFENLAAEGWMKEVQSVNQKIDERDTFGLLLQNGDDLAGAVTLKEAQP
ncbi:serine/threonine-protein kinase HipA [Amphritea atlantica]|uniref:Serine/threonine-protein kinase HipA n=1 Tax=Amphritea atlantica TaxID=355243 RepID=A0A1H9E7Z7_9GAMM|nr:HipA N-terminal domain-containing protein [Amphritea atlantica]SEQ21811.1 serine/threonine-protein kinase HipA [Amphritea atlantica]